MVLFCHGRAHNWPNDKPHPLLEDKSVLSGMEWDQVWSHLQMVYFMFEHKASGGADPVPA